MKFKKIIQLSNIYYYLKNASKWYKKEIHNNFNNKEYINHLFKSYKKDFILFKSNLVFRKSFIIFYQLLSNYIEPFDFINDLFTEHEKNNLKKVIQSTQKEKYKFKI